VAIVIPTRDRAALVAQAIAGVRASDYPSLEVVVVDNGSTDGATRRLLERLAGEAATQVVPSPGPFNFAALCNAGVAATSAPLVCLLNNDVRPLHAGWLTEMVTWVTQPGVGAVVARLL
jgi:glycosyltransferase involved in cell wall biosynthesis